MSALWGLAPSEPRTKKVAITEARMPQAAITRGKTTPLLPENATAPSVIAEMIAPT